MKELKKLFYSQLGALKQDGSLVSNISYVFGSKLIVLVSSFLIMPILSRIFDKEDFGTFGLLNNLILLSAAVVGFKLSEAFILDIPEEKFKKIARTAMSTILFGVLLLFVVFAIGGQALFGVFGITVPYWVILTLPLFIGMFALNEYQVNHIRRLKEFKKSAAISSGMDLVGRLSAVAIGLGIAANFTGLLYKEMIRVVGGMILRSRKILNGKFFPVPLGFNKLSEIKEVFREFDQFPKYLMPSVLAGMLYGSLPFYLIGSNYGVDALGEFTMVLMLMNLPAFILTNSIVSVFQRSAADWVKNDMRKLRQSSFYLLSAIVSISTLGFGLVFFYGPLIFGSFLGDEWSTAGVMAAVMVPLFLARTAAPLLESLRVVLDTQNVNLVFRVLAIVATAFSFWLGIHLGWEILDVIWLMTVLNTVLIVISIYLVMSKLGTNLFRASLILAGLVAAGFAICYIPTYFI